MPIPSYFCLICAVSLLSATVMAEVQIYGRASLSHDNIAGYNDGRANQYISSNSSRIGFRGNEALSADYRGLFQIEVPLGMDDGSGGGFAGRDSFVGIANRFGSLRFGGHIFNPVDDMHNMFGSANFAGIGNASVLWCNGYTPGPANGPGAVQWDLRLRNSVRFDSAAIGGWSTALHYSLASNETPGADIASASLRWRGSGWNVLAVGERHHNLRGSGLTDRGQWLVASRQITPAWYVGALAEQLAYASPTGGLKRHYLAGVVRYQWLPQHTLELHAGQASDVSGSNGDAVGTPGSRFYRSAGADTGALQTILQYSWDMSRRTRLYAIYTRLANRSNATYNLATPDGLAAPPGSTLSLLSLGMYVDF